MPTTQNNRPDASPRRKAPRQTPAAQERPAQRRKQEEPRRKPPASAGTKTQERPARPRQAPASQERTAPKRPQQPKAKAPAAGTPKNRNQERREPQKGLPDSVSTKRRAYGKSKPKKRSALDVLGDTLREANRKRLERAEQAPKRAARRKKRPQQPAPAVIYTQPQAFNRSRLFVQLLTVTAVVVALVMGLAVFFKVKTITVSGAEVYTAWAVREASGISEGDNLLTFSRTSAGAQIKANLPYVKEVRFGIKLPDTVNIIIEEDSVVYAIQDGNGQWWLMSSEGRVVAQANSSAAANYTQVLGVTLESPAVNSQALATESLMTQTDPEGETVSATITGAVRLNTALAILQALEDNGIVGSAASINVSSIEDITLWYGTRYQVNLGDSAQLDYKVACMNDVILQLSDYESGILDISFTIWPDRVIYTPFG